MVSRCDESKLDNPEPVRPRSLTSLPSAPKNNGAIRLNRVDDPEEDIPEALAIKPDTVLALLPSKP
jgi:hypothetical protein